MTDLDDIRPDLTIPGGADTSRFRGLRSFGEQESRRRDEAQDIWAAAAVAQQAPDLPTRSGGSGFPTGPAANDPSFRLPGRFPAVLATRALGAVGLVLSALDILDMLEELEQEKLERDIEARETIKRAEIRRRRDFPADVETIPQQVPANPTIPDVEIPAPPLEMPPAPDVRPAPEPMPLPQPSPAPAPVPTPTIPVPGPIPAPSPLPRPAPTPTTTPGRPIPPLARPGALPFPPIVPAFFPSSSPIGVPSTFSPQTPNLTRIEDQLLQSQPTPTLGSITGLETSQAPQQQAERCQNVRRRRRRKGKCREGFFREYPRRTQFVEWREVDCITREETQMSKLRDLDFDLTNVEFPNFGG